MGRAVEKPQRKGLRRAAWAAFGLLAAFAVVLAYAVHERRLAAEVLIRRALDDAGIEPVHFTVSDVDVDRLIVTGLEFGESRPVRAQRIEVRFDPRLLPQNRLGAIEVDGLSAAVELTGSAASLGDLDALLAIATGDAGGPGWSVDAIRFTNAQIELSGMVTGHLVTDGTLTPEGDDLWSGRADVGGELASAGVGPVALTGHVAARVSAGGVEHLTAHLETDRMSIAEVGTATGELTLTYVGGEAVLGVRLRSGDDRLDVDADLMTAADDPTVILGARADVDADLSNVAVSGDSMKLALKGRMHVAADETFVSVTPATEVAIATTGDGTPLELRIAPSGRPAVVLSMLADGVDTASVFVADGGFRAGDVAAGISNADIEVALSQPPRVTVRTLRLSPREVLDRDTPLDVAGTLTLRPESVDFEGRVTALQGRVSATVDGSHDLESGGGRAKIRAQPIIFSPKGLQPSDLDPGLGRGLSQVSGQIRADGDLAWSQGPLRSDLTVRVENLAFSTAGVRVSGIDAAIRLDRLQPLSTPPGQVVRIARIEAGVPITEGVVRFRLDRRGRLVVAGARFAYLGGIIAAHDPRVDMDRGQIEAVLDIESADLQTLLNAAEMEDLTASGRIDGRVPVLVTDDAMSVFGGTLESRAPGVIRYRPPAGISDPFGASEGGHLVAQALENFQYDVLRATIDGRTGGDWSAVARLEGRNPDLLGGQPFQFNISLEGDIEETVRAVLFGYALQDTLRQRMLEQRR